MTSKGQVTTPSTTREIVKLEPEATVMFKIADILSEKIADGVIMEAGDMVEGAIRGCAALFA